MLDDIRDHDPLPSSEEEEWSRTDPVALVLKALVLATVAIAIGASVSQLVSVQPPPVQVSLRPAP